MSFELNNNYNLYIFFEDNYIDFCLRSSLVKDLNIELKFYIIINQQNMFYAQIIQKSKLKIMLQEKKFSLIINILK